MAQAPQQIAELHDVPVRPFSDLRDSGLLWLINASLLHPRGFAMALCYEGGQLIGWQLLGNGSEPWVFGDDTQGPFEQVNRLLARRNEAFVEDDLPPGPPGRKV